jgi:hypothetical protein
MPRRHIIYADEKQSFLTSAADEYELVSFTLWQLYSGKKSPRHPINTSLDGPLEPAWTSWRREKFLAHARL